MDCYSFVSRPRTRLLHPPSPWLLLGGSSIVEHRVVRRYGEVIRVGLAALFFSKPARLPTPTRVGSGDRDVQLEFGRVPDFLVGSDRLTIAIRPAAIVVNLSCARDGH